MGPDKAGLINTAYDSVRDLDKNNLFSLDDLKQSLKELSETAESDESFDIKNKVIVFQ